MMNKNIKYLIERIFDDDETEELNVSDTDGVYTELGEEKRRKEAEKKINIILTARKNNVYYSVRPEETFSFPDGIFKPHEYFSYKREDTLNNRFKELIQRICDIYSGAKINLNWLDTSHISSFNGLFYGVNNAENIDISRWNISRLSNVCNMFTNTKIPDISNWDLNNSDLTSLNGMFDDCIIDCDLSKWNVNNIWDISHLFRGCSIKCDLSNWHFNALRDMRGVFTEIKYINFDFSKWDTSDVNDIREIFENVNADESNLNIKYIENLKFNNLCWIERAFADFKSKNPVDLSNFHFNNNLNDMTSVFLNSDAQFNISTWDVSRVKHFNYMFAHSTFTGDIENWNVSSAESMENMFKDAKFNGPLTNWKITNMSAFKDNDYVKDKCFNNFSTNGNALSINELINLMLEITSVPDGYEKTRFGRSQTYKKVIAPKELFKNVKIKIISM